MPTFDGSCGTIHFEQWLPQGEPTGIVVLVHGYAEYGGRYAHVAARLNSLGVAVYAEDHMGHGHSDGDRALITDFGDVVADLETLVRIATDACVLGGLIGAQGSSASDQQQQCPLHPDLHARPSPTPEYGQRSV